MRASISKKYGERTVFDGLELEIANGEVLCVLGESGVGKTTLLHILAGLTSFEGELFDVPEKVGYVFQEPRLLPWLTVEQNLCYTGGRVEVIDEILQKTGLTAHRHKRAEQLSGGEKQRVNLARAFVSEASLLLLDEPFAGLDTALKIRLMKVFAEFWKEKRPTAVLVTHDIEEAWALGHRIVVLKHGNVVYDARPPRTRFPSEYGENCEEKKKLLQAVLGGEQNL